LEQTSVALSDEDIILVLTAGLFQSYFSFIVALDATDPTYLTLEYVISYLLNEESCHLSLSPQSCPNVKSDPNKAHVALKVDSIPVCCPLTLIICFSCQQKGHYQCNCPKSQKPASKSGNFTATTATEYFSDEGEAF